MSFRCNQHPPAEGHIEQTEWLQVIWAVNDLRPGTFLDPKVGPWWAGGEVEEYPEARVIFVGDDSVRIVGKTPEVEEVIDQAARALGFTS